MDVATLARAVRRWHERNRARRALHGMSDRQLADVGLARHDIEAALRGDSRRARPFRSREGR